jgi:uncharacterized pyridoxamine 5'-phosphate oxidase family protein
MLRKSSLIWLCATLPIALMLLAGCNGEELSNATMESGDTTMPSYQEFFTNNPNGVMATVDNGEARSRTFQVLWIEDNRLYFCTGNHKPVYEQMKATPKVSFTALNPETMESVSICGTAIFIDDLAGKKRALDENPGIKEIYKTPDNPIFELLYVEVSDVSSFIFSNGK